MSQNLVSHERINSYTKKRVEFHYYFLLKITVLIKLRFKNFSKPERIELSKSRL